MVPASLALCIQLWTYRTLKNSRIISSPKFLTIWFELPLLMNPIKISMTFDLVYNINWEKEKLTKQKRSLKRTAIPEGALNFIFKRALLCARKHYKKEWTLSSLSLELSLRVKNRLRNLLGWDKRMTNELEAVWGVWSLIVHFIAFIICCYDFIAG